MKNQNYLLIFLTINLMLFSNFGFTQNLQFSQAVFVSGELQLGFAGVGPLYTVPQGKTWKIESMYSSHVAILGVKLNNNTIKLYNQSIAEPSGVVYPIWLGEGDALQAVIYNPGGNGLGTYYFSILEFNTN
jgi:hypothetical protein